MISFLADGANIPWFFARTLRRIPPNEASLIYLPTFDHTNDAGIHFPNGFARIVWSLARKKFRQSRSLSRILCRLGFFEEDVEDFDAVLALTLTAWMGRRPTVDFFKHVASGMGLKHTIVPLVDPLTSTTIITPSGMVSPINFSGNEISEIKFAPNNVGICEEAKGLIEGSTKLVLFGISPLSILFLKTMGKLSGLLQKYSGQIIYVLPSRLSDLDRATLRLLKAEPNTRGLIKVIEEDIDAVVLDEREHRGLGGPSELKFTIYPVRFNVEERAEKEKIVRALLRVLTA